MLDRARALFSRKASAAPAAEPFALRCTCGRKVDGLRRSDAQTVGCEYCGAAVFILPINPLPIPPPAKKSKALRSARSAPIAPMVESVPDDALDVSIPTPREDGAQGRKRPAILDRKWLDDEPDEEEIARRSNPLISRRQGITLGVVAFIALVSFVVYRQMTIRELVENLPDRALRGLQLVQEGKLDEAHEPLRLAWKAIDWARARHSQSDTIYQVYQEVAAVKELLPEPLDAALEASAENPSAFGKKYVGKAVLIDVEVERNPEGGWMLHWAIPVVDEVVKLDPKGLKIFDDLEIDKPTRLLIAARIEDLIRGEEGLMLRLQPTSGVLVTEFAVLEKMGLGGDAAADAVRRAQRQRVLPQ